MSKVQDLANSRQQRIVETVIRKMKSQPELVGQHLGIPDGAAPVSSKREREMYWAPDPEVQREPDRFWQEAQFAAGSSAVEGEQIEQTMERAKMLFIHRLYPARMNVIRSGSRSLSIREQIDFANNMEKLGPPEMET